MIFPCGHSFEANDLKCCPVCPQKGKNKFRSKPVKCEVHGYFHSTGEYKRYLELVLLRDDGQISNLDRQVKFWLESIKQNVIWDFTYTEVIDGQETKIAEDWKGFATADYKRKRKWFGVDWPEWTFRESRKAKRTKAPWQRQRGKVYRKKAAD